MSKRILIIGGGVGGLSAAIRLAVAGLDVTILEKNPRLGGKLNLWEAAHPERPGERPFRFDTGPSLVTLPFVFEQLFASAGERLQDHLDLVPLDPIARFTWNDGTRFELKRKSEDLVEELQRVAVEDVAGWQAFAAKGRKIWELTADLFLYHSPDQVLGGEHFSPANAAKMLTVPLRIGMFSRFASVVDRHVKSQKLREVLYQYATYSGASPFRAPATLTVIPHAEMAFGGWYPRGGMYKIAEALATLATKLGVKIVTAAPVARIQIEPCASTGKKRKRPKAVGVTLASGEELRADAVIANSDVIYTYRELIERNQRPRYPDAKLSKIEAGGSGMVLLLGVDRTYPQLAHHNKFMPADYTSDLTAMFETRTIPADPCIYVCASTRTDPTQAPPDCENLFVLASAPSLDANLDWSKKGPEYRDQLVRTLERRWGLEDLSGHIVVERTLTPVDLQSLYNANQGSIYGIGSNSRKTAFLRPPNRDRDVQNLYFAGGATHPGGGLPLVALSGKIVSELVLQDFGMAAPAREAPPLGNR